MGVVVTITLASAANIHIELNNLEAKAGSKFLQKTHEAVRRSAFFLIWCLVASVVIVVTKPLSQSNEHFAALFNGAAVLTILAGILVLVDLTKLAFNMRPLEDHNDDDTQGRP